MRADIAVKRPKDTDVVGMGADKAVKRQKEQKDIGVTCINESRHRSEKTERQ